MGFFDAIKSCFAQYATFSGRASRSEYWWWTLFAILGTMAASIVSDKASALFSLAILLPYVAVATRRLHDMGKSGWWQLVGIVPLLGWAVMIYWTVQPSEGPNAHGNGPATAG